MFHHITWRPGIGDPDFVGWVTTLLYLLAAGLCFQSGKQKGENRDSVHRKTGCLSPLQERNGKAWFIIAGILLLLGLNKQMDLQTLLIQLGRDVAVDLGWYGKRRLLQKVFVGILTAGAGLTFIRMAPRLRPFFQRHALVLPGTILLAGYVLLRAASIDHVGGMGGLSLDDSRWMAGIELSGITCFVMAGVRAGNGGKA